MRHILPGDRQILWVYKRMLYHYIGQAIPSLRKDKPGGACLVQRIITAGNYLNAMIHTTEKQLPSKPLLRIGAQQHE